MRLMNLVVLEGFLTAKPEIKVFDSGKKKASFNLGQNVYKKDKEGNSVSQGNFYSCEAWDAAAEFAEVLDTGVLVSVMGVLRQDRWTTNGQNFSRIKIVIKTITLLPKKNEGEIEQDK